jgi:hypothetical protein
VEQIPLDFSVEPTKQADVVPNEPSLDDRVRIAASDYQLQMQAYALAVGELMPSLRKDVNSIKVTLHFLEPNKEFHLSSDLLSPEACMQAIDDAMMDIISSREPHQFPVCTATHCRMCSFLGICTAGREFVRALRRAGAEPRDSAKAVEAGR